MIVKGNDGEFYEVPALGPGPVLRKQQEQGHMPVLPLGRFAIYVDRQGNAVSSCVYSLRYNFPAYASFWPDRRSLAYKLIQTVKVTPK